MDATHTDVLYTQVVISTTTDFDLISESWAPLNIVKVDHVEVFLPRRGQEVPLRMDVAFLQEALKNNIVVQWLANFIQFNWLAFLKRIRYTIFILGLTDLTVEGFPRVCDHLLITGDSHDISSRQPLLQAQQMDNLLRSCASAWANQRIFFRLIICETETADQSGWFITVTRAAHWLFF